MHIPSNSVLVPKNCGGFVKSEGWDKVLAGVRTETLAGNGYTIELMLPWAVRYRAGDRVLTVPSDLRPKRTDDHWWTWFTGWYTPFYLESPMLWDDEKVPMSVSEAETALTRLKEFLDKRLKKKYRFLMGERVDEFMANSRYKGHGQIF
jgi:hypothetical protein